MKRSQLRAIGIVALAIVLVLFGRSLPARRSEQQLAFDHWSLSKEKILREVEEHSGDGTRSPELVSPVSLPVLFLEMVGYESLDPSVSRIAVTEEAGVIDQTLRLFQLMRESDIFSIGSRISEPNSGQPHVVLRVVDGKQEFSASFRERDIEGNVQALLLLKLFREFGR